MYRDDSLLRVEFAGSVVKLDTVGLKTRLLSLDLPYEMPVDKLPLWLHRKLAILQVMPYDPPTEHVENIGRRMRENVFWVQYEEEDIHGYDTGKTSEEQSSEAVERARE